MARKPKTTDEAPTTIKAYKGFDKNFQCRGYQLEPGKTYEHDGPVEACSSGFHACTSPFDVWRYYPPAMSQFAEVVASGEVKTHSDDSKIAAQRITIGAQISLAGFIKLGVEALFERAKKEGSATSGYGSTSATSGNYSTSATSGNYSTSATSGNRSTSATSGDRSTSATSGYGSTSATSGNYSTSATSGDRSTSEANGKSSIAVAGGVGSKAKAALGSGFVLGEYDDCRNLVRLHAAMAGQDGIKPDTYYRVAGGKLVEA